jgi:cell division protein FtsQ
MTKEKVIDLGDRVPKLKQEQRKKSNYRLIFYISFFFFVMILVLYFQSAFSNISQLKVEGNQYVTEEKIIELTEITNETSYWKISEEEIEEKIKKHEEIKSVTVTKKFPNHVQINVEEHGTIGYLVKDSGYHPVLENGIILNSAVKDKGVFPVQAPLLFGFRQGEELQELAAEMSLLPESIKRSISEIHYPTTSDQSFRISLFMTEGFEVSVSIQDFSQKMLFYPSIAKQENKNVRGVIDLEGANKEEGYAGSFSQYDSE